MIILYKYLGIILIPLIKLNVFFRIFRGQENKARFSDRYGITSTERPITMELLKQKSIKSLLVNVRMSPQSFKKWKIISIKKIRKRY